MTHKTIQFTKNFKSLQIAIIYDTKTLNGVTLLLSTKRINIFAARKLTKKLILYKKLNFEQPQFFSYGHLVRINLTHESVLKANGNFI